MYALAEELYPLCRSLTGPGVRETLHVIGRQIPLDFHEVPSGTQVFDWVVPNEWRVREAYIADSTGRRVVDFRELNLHVVGYSSPVHRQMTLAELRPHLHTLPERPEAVALSHGLLRRVLGLLPVSAAARNAIRRRDLRGLHRRQPVPGHAFLWRVVSAR